MDYEVGDLVEDTSMPGFVMRVLAVRECDQGDVPEVHAAYRIEGPEGCLEWLCAREVCVVTGDY